ncbi:MAG: hypothetical protein IJS89_02105 [Bacteroidaceae bacterium]|nr:hypothetical protein [Bacteroidaceae bacterium]
MVFSKSHIVSPTGSVRFAVLRLHLPDGTLLMRQVVETHNGRYVRHYPLQEETPHTPWLRGDYYVENPDQPDAR